jgi:hypothetical protein
MKKFIITLLGILIMAAGTLQAAPQGPGHPGKAHQARHEVRRDKAKLRHNVKNGNEKAAHRNAKKLKHDRKKEHRARKNHQQ